MASEHLRMAIQELEAKLREQLAQAAKTKSGINQLAELAGIPIPYPETEEKVTSRAMRPDVFYGKSLQTAMREYLHMRGPQTGPATVNEIYEALVAGGHQFEAKNEANAKRIIRITLTKRSAIFHKLPNGSYGLLAWYPNAKTAKAAKAGKPASPADDETPDDEGEDVDPDDADEGDDQEGGEDDA